METVLKKFRTELMEIVLILVPASLLLALVAILGFIWAVKRGQFQDLRTPAMRILFDEEPPTTGSEEEEPGKSLINR